MIKDRLGRYNMRGRKPKRRVIAPQNSRIGSEHLMTIWELYTQDLMSLTEIAQMYGRSTSAIHGILRRINSSMKKGADGERYISRALSYSAALKLLDTKRFMTYKAIARNTGLEPAVVRDIARRNNLER